MNRFTFAITLLAMVGGGCASEQARVVDCDRLVDHYTELVSAGDDVDRAQYLDQCRALALTEHDERCVLAATNMGELERCGVRQNAAPEQASR